MVHWGITGYLSRAQAFALVKEHLPHKVYSVGAVTIKWGSLSGRGLCVACAFYGSCIRLSLFSCAATFCYKCWPASPSMHFSHRSTISCLLFQLHFWVCVVLDVSGGCHYNFRLLGLISMIAAFTLTFFFAHLSELLWAIVLSISICVFLVLALYKVKVDAISPALEPFITVVLYCFCQIVCCNIFEQDLHLFICARGGGYACNIAHKHLHFFFFRCDVAF